MSRPALPWEAVLVDFGGTLDGDGVHWSRRFDRVFRTFGLTYPDSALQEAFRDSERAVNLETSGVCRMGLAECIAFQSRLMLEQLGCADGAVHQGVAGHLAAETRDYLRRNAGALRALHGRARVGVLSNFTGNLEQILREEGLLPWVDGVFDSAVVGLRKPDPAFFRHALARLGGEPGHSAMVGDSVDMDLRPARALGLAAIWVEGEAPRESGDFRPDHTLRNLAQLPRLWGAEP